MGVSDNMTLVTPLIQGNWLALLMIRQVLKNRIGTLTTISNGTSYLSFYSAKQVSCQQARGALDWPTSPEAQERRACSRVEGVMMDMLGRAPLAPHRKLGV